jgi:glycyl-tRNA synthetase beta chain
MSEFVLEIGTEEIPARMAPPAAAQLRTLFLGELTETLKVALDEGGTVASFCTPRRLVLVARGLPARQPDRVEEKIGPAKNVAFDAAGQPTKAGQGFARGQGVDPSALTVVETPKGAYVCVRREVVGQPLAALLGDVLPRICARLHFPKSMRWGTEPTAFVRPIHWIVALFDGAVVPFSYAGVTSGRESRGHRFLAPTPFPVSGADDLLARLAEAHVVLDPAERRRRIVADIERLAESAGGRIVANDALLDEVVNLVESPQTTLGHFDAGFLAVPKDVLISAMAKHQRYFSIETPDGSLVNAFCVVNNTRARDMATVTAGNERVLEGRLEDARFFFDDDRRRPLAHFLPALGERVFLKGLGSVRAKSERVAALSAALADTLAPAARETARRAAELSKADLPTQVVGEFPDLQGVMGREYARLSGEPEAVATAIFEHYLPRSADDILPATDAGAIVSLADKADSIVGCFGLGLTPTATQDPYALRRQALGIVRVLVDRGWTVSLTTLLVPAIAGYGDLLKKAPQPLLDEILTFFDGRLRAMLRETYPVDVVDAVLSTGSEYVLDAIEKVKALATLKAQSDFEPLAIAFKRVGNILDKAGIRLPAGAADAAAAAALVEPAERALAAAHEAAARDVAALLERRDFAAALRRVTELRPAVDAFFDGVMVMAEDEGLRAARVGLLQSIDATFRRIADFGRIQLEKG